MAYSTENECTDYYVWVVRSAGRGSDYYGQCEVCNKSCSEHFVAQKCGVDVRPNGHFLISRWIGMGIYGHLECLSKHCGELINRDSLQRVGRSYLLPESLVNKLQLGHV